MSKIISSPGPVWWNSRVLTQFWNKLKELERLSETLPSAGVSTMLFFRVIFILQYFHEREQRIIKFLSQQN